jgi:hypothetical protein
MAHGEPRLRRAAKIRAAATFCLAGAVAGTSMYFANLTLVKASDDAAASTPPSSVYTTASDFDRPDAVAVDGTQVWIANGKGNSVTELNAADSSLWQTLAGVGYGFNDPDAVVVAGTHIWIANGHGASVTELNAADGSLMQTLSDAASYGFNNPDAVAVAGAHIWITNGKGNSVTELGPV